MDLDTRRNLKILMQNFFVYDMNDLSCLTCCACTVCLCVCVRACMHASMRACVCGCVHVHTQLHACLVCLHAVQLTCVLDMCNTSTKHNGSGQVVQVGAAAPRVFNSKYLLTCAGGVFPSIHWCKYSTCTRGGHHPFQLVVVVFYCQPLAQILHLHLCNLHCVVVVYVVVVGVYMWWCL